MRTSGEVDYRDHVTEDGLPIADVRNISDCNGLVVAFFAHYAHELVTVARQSAYQGTTYEAVSAGYQYPCHYEHSA
jgi:hypothetical protein